MAKKEYKSIKNQILVLIQEKDLGELIFSSDYFHMGNPEAINMAFSRLAKEERLIRLAKGIYLNPKIDPQLGKLHPSLEDVAHAIANKEKVRIRPTGAYALNRLGLSTQVPMKVVFLTDGSPRKIKIGKGTISFKHTTPKKLAAEDPLTFLVIQALLELGKDGIDDEVFNRLHQVLQDKSTKTIREDAKLAPIWIAKILYLIAEKIDNS